MRILLINPNATEAVTDRVAAHMRGIGGPSVEVVPATGRFGARYIASWASAAIAAHAALDAFAEHGAGCDAIYLACFGDPGLLALRELSPVPVVGMAEAACREAAASGRFSIVTGGTAWKTMLTEFVASLGLSGQLASIRTITATGGEIHRDPDAAMADLIAACRACPDADGAETVILGGAGLAGLAELIQPMVKCRLICSVEAGTRAVLAAAARPTSLIRPAPAASTGLTPALARLLAGG